LRLSYATVTVFIRNIVDYITKLCHILCGLQPTALTTWRPREQVKAVEGSVFLSVFRSPSAVTRAGRAEAP